MGCRSSESCLLDKVLDIAVMCVYEVRNVQNYNWWVPCVIYNKVLNKIFWGRQLHQGVKSLEPRRQQHLEDGDGVSPWNFGELPHIRGCLPLEDFIEFCHRESLKI
jgi:hypothetical protein